jgi:hypothetical protein
VRHDDGMLVDQIQHWERQPSVSQHRRTQSERAKPNLGTSSLVAPTVMRYLEDWMTGTLKV